MTPLIKPRPKPMGRIPRTPYTDALKAKAVQLVKDGHSLTAVGKACGVHKTAVKRWCLDAGHQPAKRPYQHSAATRERALELIRSGYSYAVAGDILGIHREVVRRWADKAGIDSPCAHNRGNTTAKPPIGEKRVPPILTSGAMYRIVTKTGKVYEKARYHRGAFRIQSSWNDLVFPLKEVELVADLRIWTRITKVGHEPSVRRNYFYPVAECTFGFKVGEEPDESRLPPPTWVNPIRRRVLQAR